MNKCIFILNKILNISLLFVVFIFVWLVCKIFFFASFKIPSDSMQPEIESGDIAVVWKPSMGMRLFNILGSLEGKQPKIYRVLKFKEAEREDVMVFNYPYSRGLDKISMHIMNYYIKRCVALPGDTISIIDGYYYVSGYQGFLGDLKSQKKWSNVSEKILRRKNLWNTYPNDSLLNWNVKDFGPLFIPKRDTEIFIDSIHYTLYKKLIEWETNDQLFFYTEKNCFYLGNKPISNYRFQHDYYFMAGDNVNSSQDSRYWGVVPDVFIVGRVAFILKFYDFNSKEPIWCQIFRVVH